jgi:hypoxanthine phosphoribosyltransferase
VTDQTRQATPAFAHASEAEMARILDFYGIAWEYEPHTFPILWNLDGDVVESFSPDFYLAELDLYLEMTTLRQKLVRKKNRKLRRLRELYPDVRIKLFYARDFRALMLKYGKLALADALTGTAGQAGPPEDLPSEQIIEPEPAAVPIVEADRAGEPATTATMRRTASRRRRRRRAAAAASSPSTHPDRPGND